MSESAHEATNSSLFISCCFLPYINACAMTVAKKMLTWGGKIDVISGQTEHEMDQKAMLLVSDLIENHKIIKQSFTGFGSGIEMELFATKCQQQYHEWLKQGGEYNKLYSRAMLPVSHIAAAMYKVEHPDVIWTADFSDPLLFDIRGRMRCSNFSLKWYQTNISPILSKLNLTPVDHEVNLNSYYWAELLPFILADELVFINNIALEYILSRFPLPFLHDENIKFLNGLRLKSKCHPHDTLPPKFYNLGTPVSLPKGTKNIGYFGTLYDLKVIKELFKVVNEFRTKIDLHIYTHPHTIHSLKKLSRSFKRIHIYPLLSFFDFLSSINQFDLVIAMDSCVYQHLKTNPYVPSKFSDYMGASTPIWLLTEPDSYVDRLPIINNLYNKKIVYKTRIRDIKKNCEGILSSI